MNNYSNLMQETLYSEAQKALQVTIEYTQIFYAKERISL